MLKHVGCCHLRPMQKNFLSSFVPQHEPCNDAGLNKLQEFVDCSKRLFVLTGAGISTESGIPDYRSEGVGLYATSKKRPVQFKDFLSSSEVRKSYWARNFKIWPHFSSFQPNESHRSLARWESGGKVSCLVTQNVDRLHQKAGSKYVIELHGSSFQVVCLSCSHMTMRKDFQGELSSLNDYLEFHAGPIRPDGDVELSNDEVNQFRVPNCRRCGGLLKPHIVFFGDNVPSARVNKVRQELASSDAVLAVGTSLTVFSSFRFILQAQELSLPIAIVNIGKTRGDKLAFLKIETKSGDILPKIVHN